ncbi:MAG: methyltransferase [Pseudomonadota bacterium]
MQDPIRRELMEMIQGGWVAHCLGAACRLALPERLEGGALSLAELAEAVSAQERNLARLMRALAGLGLVRRLEDDRYELSEKGQLLRAEHPLSLRGFALLATSPEIQNAWGGLTFGVQSGEVAFERIYEKSFTDYAGDNPEFGRLVEQALRDKDRGTVAALLTAYDFSPFQTIADLGGGEGHLLLCVLAKNFNARGILFDLPDVAEKAKAAVSEHPTGSRCRVVGGDCFQAVPRGADLYLMKSFLNLWEDAAAVTVLNNCRRAMAPGSRLLIIEPILLPPNRPDPAKLADLQLMVLQKTGLRDWDQIEALLGQAGFEALELYPSDSEFSIIEAQPMV